MNQPTPTTFSELHAQTWGAPNLSPVQTPESIRLGSATLPATQPSPAGGGSFNPVAPQAPPAAPPAPQPNRQYLTMYEQQNKVPAGRFQTDQEMFDALYNLSVGLADEVETLRQPAAPPAPAPGVAPVVQQPAAPQADLAKVANAFQQQGLLAFTNGQWTATSPMAQEVAVQMNRLVMEAQVRQAEMADPATWIKKYGADVLKEMVTPIQTELDTIKQQNQALQQQLANSQPKPYEAWINQHEAQLWAADATGRKVHTSAGKAYHDAWAAAENAGVQDPAALHNIASLTATPYLTQPQQQAPAQPQQTFMETVAHQRPQDSSFNLPGSTFSSQVPPGQLGFPVNNKGFPDWSAMQAQQWAGQ